MALRKKVVSNTHPKKYLQSEKSQTVRAKDNLKEDVNLVTHFLSYMFYLCAKNTASFLIYYVSTHTHTHLYCLLFQPLLKARLVYTWLILSLMACLNPRKYFNVLDSKNVWLSHWDFVFTYEKQQCSNTTQLAVTGSTLLEADCIPPSSGCAQSMLWMS